MADQDGIEPVRRGPECRQRISGKMETDRFIAEGREHLLVAQELVVFGFDNQYRLTFAQRQGCWRRLSGTGRLGRGQPCLETAAVSWPALHIHRPVVVADN